MHLAQNPPPSYGRAGRTAGQVARGLPWTIASLVISLWLLGVAAVESAAEEPRPVALPLVQQWPLELPPHHVQGLSATEDTFWVSSVDRRERKGWVLRIDRETLKIVASRDVTLAAQYHPGGIQEAKGALWVPVAEYRPRSTTTVLKLDPTTLETLSSFRCDDHLGATASDGAGTIYGLNWDARVLYYFDEEGRLKEKRDNPTGVAYQDLDYWDGLLFGCGRAEIDGQKVAVVDALDPKTFELQMRYLPQGETRDGGSDFSREGFAKLYDSFFLLPEDGPHSAVYRFGLPAQ